MTDGKGFYSATCGKSMKPYQVAEHERWCKKCIQVLRDDADRMSN